MSGDADDNASDTTKDAFSKRYSQIKNKQLVRLMRKVAQEEDDEKFQQFVKLVVRADQNCLYGLCLLTIYNKYFVLGVNMVVFTNTVI